MFRCGAERSLCPGGEDRLEIGTLLLPRNDADIDVFKAGVFQKLMQLHFAETEPVIGVKLARAFEGMTQQIENYDAPVLSLNRMRALDRSFRSRGMMQRLAENCEIDAVLFNGRLLHVAKSILDVAEAMLLRQFRREFDHLWGIIDGDDFARVFSEQLRKCAFARAQIGDG